MNSKIQIINQALVELGQSPIDDLPPGNTSIPAIIAKTFWDASVEAVLRGHPWNFAVRRQVLARLNEAPVFGFGSSFSLPVDCLRVLEVTADPYKLEGRAILCDDTSLALRYITRAVTVAEYDALFSDALSLYLAWKMAYPITKSEAVRDACWNSYVQLLVQARSVDAQEDPPDDFGDSTLLSVRG